MLTFCAASGRWTIPSSSACITRSTSCMTTSSRSPAPPSALPLRVAPSASRRPRATAARLATRRSRTKLLAAPSGGARHGSTSSTGGSWRTARGAPRAACACEAVFPASRGPSTILGSSTFSPRGQYPSRRRAYSGRSATRSRGKVSRACRQPSMQTASSTRFEGGSNRPDIVARTPESVEALGASSASRDRVASAGSPSALIKSEMMSA
mmetsp:Transcript_56181/g.128971  ORF Transcript_56181/g.128971 Transcript_56181/m.128971 type:complete len:210 (-) Transcript_56181:140-769(-)